MLLLSNNFESFGLDIGDRSLKVAYIKKRGSTPRLLSFGALPVPEGIFEQGEIKKPDDLALLIKEVVKTSTGKKISTPYVNACLPETHSFIKLLTLNTVHDGELPALVREDLPNHIPMNIDELYIDWHLVERLDDKQAQVLVGAVPKTIADSYAACLSSAGFEAVSLQIEAEAIARALLPQNDLPKTSIALVDIGATRSSFICFDKGSIQFTITMDISGDKITNLIKDKLNLTWAEAERAKQICGLDHQTGEGIIMEIVKSVVDELTSAIGKNIAYYSEHFTHASPITSIVLCGGGARLPSLKESLAAKLGKINIYHANSLINLVKNLKNKVNRNTNESSLNFLHPDITFEKVPAKGWSAWGGKSQEPMSADTAITYTTAIGLALSNVFN